ncbi:MAG TPA: hypothetical protein VIM22_01255 [Solirubrobacteraceae bacterium]|jgi:hypothetical protein
MSDHASQLGAVAKRLEQAADRLKAQNGSPVPAPDAVPALPPPGDLSGPLARLREAGDDVQRARVRLAEIQARLRAA